jgi:antirestriction factor ArdC-like protein/uncharacterized protein DUF955
VTSTPAQQKLEALHERLVDEVRKIRTGDDWRAWLDVATRFRKYSFRNVLLIGAQFPNAARVAGYTTWKALGRQVNKGEKGIEILAPVSRRREFEDPDGRPESADPRPTRRVVGVRRVFVWDISQTTGPDLPQAPAPARLEGNAPSGLWNKLADQVDDAGYTLHRERLASEDLYGYTDFTAHRVVVADRLTNADAVATLAHEVAHMHMHDPSDSNSGFDASTTRSCRGVREVEAESVAYIVTAHHGLETGKASFPYVATWATRSDKDEPERVVQQTGERVMSTARRIISAIDTTAAADVLAPRINRTIRPLNASVPQPVHGEPARPGLDCRGL